MECINIIRQIGDSKIVEHTLKKKRKEEHSKDLEISVVVEEQLLRKDSNRTIYVLVPVLLC